MADTSIAFFGTKGSFTYLAAQKYFDPSSNFISCSRFRDVFESVRDEIATYGVIPIENTLAGSIYENYDLLTECGLSIVGEVSLRIEHALLVNRSYPSVSANDVTEVYSHQKALEQCDRYLRSHPSMHPNPYDDTATAAKFIAEHADSEPWAAIAHPGNAKLWKLRILAKNIEDNDKNFTRFFVVAKDRSRIGEHANKCSLSFSLPHQVGSLSEVLMHFTKQKINLTKIESRPLIGRPFEYIFYVDLILPLGIEEKQLIQGLEQYTKSYHILGAYSPAI